MFTKEERLFIWKKVYEIIDRLEDGEYICVALRNYGWFGCLSPETKEVRLNIVKDIIKELE